MHQIFKEVLEVPKLKYTERVEYDGIQYIHGREEQQDPKARQICSLLF